MEENCIKCGGEMDEGRIPIPHKYLFGYKSKSQKHFSFEANIQRARVCLCCGYLEFYLDPNEIKEKLKK